MQTEKSKRSDNLTILILIMAITILFLTGPVYAVYQMGVVEKYEDFLEFAAFYLFSTVLISFFAVKYSFTRLMNKEKIEKNRIIESVNILKKQKEDIIAEKKALEENMKIKEEELEKEKLYFKNHSIIDEQTGLYGKNYFYKILSDEINRAKRDKKQLMLAFLEIDNFDGYSKRYGINAAESAIEIIGKEITKCAKRSADFSFRVDKFRFAVILSGLSLDNAKRFIAFIKENIDSKKIEFNQEEIEECLSVSIGFALSFSEALPSSEEFQEKAQRALQRAKENKEEKVGFEVIE